MKASLFLLATAALQAFAAPTSTSSEIKVFLKSESIQADSLVNIYIEYGDSSQEEQFTLAYGSCEDPSSAQPIEQVDAITTTTTEKIAWHVPSSTESGCLFLKDNTDQVVSQSQPYTVTKKLSKRAHPELQEMFFDAVDYHKNKKISKRAVATSKNKRIGIVGAGMSGLFSGFLLDQAGFHNYEILEANDRLGGRVHTTYFGKTGTAYQEMGPMRFPIEFEYEGKTLPVTDHQIVFQLVDELNKLNKKSFHVEFIQWYQSRDNNLYYKNGYRLPDGKIPTVAEYKATSHLAPATDDITALSTEVSAAMSEFSMDRWAKLMGSDMYAAHAKAIEEGYDDWSEWGWLHNKMGLSLNATDYHTGLSPGNIWNTMYDSFTFGRSTNWRTVQGGLNRIAEAFGPVLGEKVQFGIQVSKLTYEENNQVSVQWKKNVNDRKYRSKTYDYVIVSAPFSVVRNWHLPELDYTLNQAIHNLPYKPSCKVALEFKKRFWEHLDQPIEGGCDSTDLWSGTICYPVNNIGSKGTGVVLASYVSGLGGQDRAAMKEEEHVARVLDDFRELHGDELVNKYYTGKYDRVCWTLDHLQGGGMAHAEPGQHKLYMPSYFKMNQGLVFVGEHTDIKHAWISAALESAIRGVVMILVETGHVDEAKAIVTKYNAKWMKI